MDELLAVLTERLEQFGLQVAARERAVDRERGSDLRVTLTRGSARQEFAWELVRHARLAHAGTVSAPRDGDLPLLVGAASVSPRTADAFRRAGIQYVDGSGNAWLHFGDVLIDVRGRRVDLRASEVTSERGGNLFSTARAQVAFVLLQWPRSWERSQRDLAQAAGVSLGQVNDALKMFRQVGFGPGGHRTDAEFLDLWVASFPTGLAKKLLLAGFRGSIEDVRKAGPEDPVFVAGAAVSGELAADDLLRPAALILYVAELDPLLPVRNRWRSDGASNIAVRRKFWTTPPEETHDDDKPLVGLRTAPAVLVYADLSASDNPRVRSVAREWRERVARREQDH